MKQVVAHSKKLVRGDIKLFAIGLGVAYVLSQLL